MLDSGEIPFSERPVEKDTIAVPSGGYAVVRMVADNPGTLRYNQGGVIMGSTLRGYVTNVEVPKPA